MADESGADSLMIILATVLVTILSIIFIIPTIWFYKRRHYQPIKAKTPWLIIVSTIGNYIFISITLLNMIVHLRLEAGSQSQTEKIMDQINRLQTFISHPLFFIPYVLRAWRILKIFRISKDFLLYTPQDARREALSQNINKTLKESYYHKIMIFIMIPCMGLGIASIWDKVAYNFPLSYYDPMFDLTRGTEHLTDFEIAITFGLFIFFLEEMFYLCLIYLLRNTMSEFNMKTELKMICGLWIILTSACTGLEVFGCKATMSQIALILLIIRNLACFGISLCWPIYESYNSKIMPYGETRECVSSIEMTLSTITPLQYFTQYIRSTAPQHLATLHLYMEIKMFEELAGSQEISDNPLNLGSPAREGHLDIRRLYDKGIRIYKEYLEKGANNVLRYIPEAVHDIMLQRFRDLKENLDKHLFDPIYGVIIKQLNNLFLEFAKSTLHHQLIYELAKTEIYYERLRIAEMN